jgi:hypothetical protein
LVLHGYQAMYLLLDEWHRACTTGEKGGVAQEWNTVFKWNWLYSVCGVEGAWSVL